jgi:hypothetical protein
LAKKRSSSRRISTRPIVKQIDSHIKALRAIKAGASPQEKKKAQRHIGKLTKIRAMTTAICDGYFLRVD